MGRQVISRPEKQVRVDTGHLAADDQNYAFSVGHAEIESVQRDCVFAGFQRQDEMALRFQPASQLNGIFVKRPVNRLFGSQGGLADARIGGIRGNTTEIGVGEPEPIRRTEDGAYVPG